MHQKDNDSLKPRRKPRQDRSILRAQQIMDVTALLLDRVGFDDLTTILITKELGISVGSLYHYFPNKHAILRSLAENWLKDWDKALEEMRLLAVEEMDLSTIVDELTALMLTVYQQQKGILPLVQAMYAVPELRDLDDQHDELVINCLTSLFVRMGFKQSKSELARVANIYLQITHNMLIIVLEQKGTTASRTMNDLNAIVLGLIEQYTNT